MVLWDFIDYDARSRSQLQHACRTVMQKREMKETAFMNSSRHSSGRIDCRSSIALHDTDK